MTTPVSAEPAFGQVPKKLTPSGVGTSKKSSLASKRVWVDLDNSPHVPFFRPIIAELRRRGHEVLVTARDAYQVRELLEYYGVSARVVGKHYGKHKVLKSLGTLYRSAVLAAIVRREKPDLSVCHGSRGCMLASALLRIPNVTLIDYEFAAKIPTIRPTWLMVPSVVPEQSFHVPGSRVMKYPGLKEDVYLPRFRPDPGLRQRLGISPDAIVVTVRPPATEAHYHNPESEPLLDAALKRVATDPSAKVILLPRNKNQESQLRAAWKSSIASGSIVVPEKVEDGLNVIWNSDLVISGGGTMNREAAAMGVPVYSIFRGQIGAVDQYLANSGRLTLLTSVDQVNARVHVVRRTKPMDGLSDRTVPALETIIENLESILEIEAGSALHRQR